MAPLGLYVAASLALIATPGQDMLYVIARSLAQGRWAGLCSAFGVCHNAYDPTRSPSGSSCGSAIGLAANYATLAIGEDTAGSIRGPASHASLVALRPTLPLVSRFGMLPHLLAAQVYELTSAELDEFGLAMLDFGSLSDAYEWFDEHFSG